MAPDAENYRGINAVRVLSQKSVFTLDTLIAAANDPHLAAFDELLPALLDAYNTVSRDSVNASPDLAEAIQILQAWDKSYGINSIGQTLAIHWAEKIQRLARSRAAADQRFDNLGLTQFTISSTSAQEKVTALATVLNDLNRDFKTWKTPWGDINRYQRLTGRIEEVYDDQKPSLPVAFTSSAWGSLAAFGARTYPAPKNATVAWEIVLWRLLNLANGLKPNPWLRVVKAVNPAPGTSSIRLSYTRRASLRMFCFTPKM
jgi:acyl-homoserine lactone acylase PvdQ